MKHLSYAIVAAAAMISVALYSLEPAYGQVNETIVSDQSAVALNGSQASRTGSVIGVRNHSVLRYYYDYDYDAVGASATELEIYCETSDNGTTNWRLIDVPGTNGLLTPDLPLFEYDATTFPSADRKFDVRIGVESFNYIRCYVTVASATALDTITSSYVLSSHPAR